MPKIVGPKSPAVNLTKYVQISSNEWRYCPVVRAANGRIKPHWVMVKGKPERHEEGSYWLDWREEGKRKRASVGNDPVHAQAEHMRQAAALNAHAVGLALPGPSKPKRVKIEDACSAFVENARLQHKHKTYLRYRRSAKYFADLCNKTYLDEFDKRDLHLIVEQLRERFRHSDRTVSNHAEVIRSILKANGFSGLLRNRDMPKYVEKKPEAVSAQVPSDVRDNASSREMGRA